MAADGLLPLAHRFKADWRLAAPVLLADAAGMVFGWGYYWAVGQFDPASPHYQPPWLWPLVADSPNAVLLIFGATLAYLLAGWRHRVLDALAFTLNVYVGLWTTMLFLAYPEQLDTFVWGSTNNILFFTHMGMPLQALVLAQDMRRDRWRWGGVALVLAALAAYVAVDYAGPMLHPAPDLHPRDDVIHLGSPLLMAAAAGAWLLVCRPLRRGV